MLSGAARARRRSVVYWSIEPGASLRSPPASTPASSLLGSLALLLMLACGTEEPVLLGVEPEPDPLTEAESSARDQVWKRELPESAYEQDPGLQAQAYSKPEGVYVDIRWLGGRRYTDIAEELEEQLGALVSRTELDSRRGEELSYERGDVRVVRGVVYMLRVQLPEPLTRTDALLATGFTIYADHWRETHREFRLSHSFEFERFRLRRHDERRDRVVSVEAWKRSPEDIRN